MTNPASNEKLLSEAAGFLVKNHFDLKALMREILQSETYQRSSVALPENQDDTRFYSHYYPRRLMAEVMLDAVSQVTAVPTTLSHGQAQRQQGPRRLVSHGLPRPAASRLQHRLAISSTASAGPTACRPANASGPTSRAWPRRCTSPMATRSTKLAAKDNRLDAAPGQRQARTREIVEEALSPRPQPLRRPRRRRPAMLEAPRQPPSPTEKRAGAGRRVLEPDERAGLFLQPLSSHARIVHRALSARAFPTLRSASALRAVVSRAATRAAPVDFAREDRAASSRSIASTATRPTIPDGEFNLETFEALIKGGKAGKAIEPGNAQDSLLVKFLEGRSGKEGKNKFMPPGKKEHLKPEEIALIRQWIDAGAPAARRAGEARRRAGESAEDRAEGASARRRIHALAFSPQARLIAAGSYALRAIARCRHAAAVRTLEGIAGKVNALAFSADGSMLFAAAGDAGLSGVAYQWKVADGTLVRKFEGHTDALYALALSPDGKTLATGSYDQKIKLWNVADGAGDRDAERAQWRRLRPEFPARWQGARQRQRGPHGQALGRRHGQAARHLFAAVEGANRRRLLARWQDARRRRRGQSHPPFGASAPRRWRGRIRCCSRASRMRARS